MNTNCQGTNAAWLRLALLAHNLLTALKRLALTQELLMARPKRLRFLLFTLPGRLITHARELWLRLATTPDRLVQWLAHIQLLPAPTAGNLSRTGLHGLKTKPQR